MALNRPSLSQLIARAIADMQARMPGADPLLRHSVLGVLARMHAGAVHGVYGLLEFVSQQITPATAQSEWLVMWASVYDLARAPASVAAGNVELAGSKGTTAPLGLELQSSNGIACVTTESATIANNGYAVVAVVTRETGAAGNLPSGAPLNLISPLAGIESIAHVSAGGLAGGADTETDAALRARLLARIQRPPHGGNKNDYATWAGEVPGVASRWVVPLYDGDGSVRIWIEQANYQGPRLATDALVDQVQAYIDARRPVGFTRCTVAAPTVVKQPIALTLLPDTVDVRSAVVAELQQVFMREAAPEQAIPISRIREAVSIAAGETDNVIETPTTNVDPGKGGISILGKITFR